MVSGKFSAFITRCGEAAPALSPASPTPTPTAIRDAPPRKILANTKVVLFVQPRIDISILHFTGRSSLRALGCERPEKVSGCPTKSEDLCDTPVQTNLATQEVLAQSVDCEILTAVVADGLVISNPNRLRLTQPDLAKRPFRNGSISETPHPRVVVSETICLTSVGETMESRPCSGCGTDLRTPGLTTPTDVGESWWCEDCVRRTLEAIQKLSPGQRHARTALTALEWLRKTAPVSGD